MHVLLICARRPSLHFFSGKYKNTQNHYWRNIILIGGWDSAFRSSINGMTTVTSCRLCRSLRLSLSLLLEAALCLMVEVIIWRGPLMSKDFHYSNCFERIVQRYATEVLPVCNLWMVITLWSDYRKKKIVHIPSLQSEQSWKRYKGPTSVGMIFGIMINTSIFCEIPERPWLFA